MLRGRAKAQLPPEHGWERLQPSLSQGPLPSAGGATVSGAMGTGLKGHWTKMVGHSSMLLAESSSLLASLLTVHALSCPDPLSTLYLVLYLDEEIASVGSIVWKKLIDWTSLT